MTLLVASHDPTVASRCDRIVKLRDGTSPTTSPSKRPARASTYWSASSACHQAHRKGASPSGVAVAQQPTPAKQHHYLRLGLLRSHSPSLTEVLWRVLSWYPDACMVNNSA